ncbi:MAG: hypothetical protein EBT58_08035 [Betaproteobacteria bacterium]|nr:hypothetical protein [Betaproteobacteria bacterium]
MQSGLKNRLVRSQPPQRSLDIRFDEETGYFITKVKAQGSGDIVRQIPSEEMLRISRNIDQMRGRLIDLLA